MLVDHGGTGYRDILGVRPVQGQFGGRPAPEQGGGGFVFGERGCGGELVIVQIDLRAIYVPERRGADLRYGGTTTYKV